MAAASLFLSNMSDMTWSDDGLAWQSICFHINETKLSVKKLTFLVVVVLFMSDGSSTSMPASSTVVKSMDLLLVKELKRTCLPHSFSLF